MNLKLVLQITTRAQDRSAQTKTAISFISFMKEKLDGSNIISHE